MEAGKVKVLMSLLDQYQTEGRRVLVFSQVSSEFIDLIAFR